MQSGGEQETKNRKHNHSLEPLVPLVSWVVIVRFSERTGFTSAGKALCFGCLFTQAFLLHCGNKWERGNKWEFVVNSGTSF